MTDRPKVTVGVNKAYKILQNDKVNKLFAQDSHLSFVLGNIKANEYLFGKGHETDPALGSYALISEDYYLKIILHEIDNEHSLVFKSNTQILQTRKRPFISINFIESTNNIELFVDSLPVSFSLDTSEAHYRTNINQFTGLNVTDDFFSMGRGQIVPYGEFECFYTLAEEKVLKQSEIYKYYITQIDDRVLPDLGKILFISNRDGSLYKVYEMLESGEDVQLKYSVGTSDMLNPQYEISKDGFTVATNGIASYRNDAGVLKTQTGLSANINTAILTCDKKYLIFNHSDNVHGKDIAINGNLFDFNSLSNGTNAAYFNNYPLSSHPTSNVKFLMTRMSNSQPNTLVERNFSTHTEVQIFATPYSGSTYSQKIFGARYSKDGSKIGFNCYYNDSGSDYRAYICNSDGSNLTLLAQTTASSPTNFCAFSPDGTKVLLSKITSGEGYTNKAQLFIRDLTTNEETQITFHNSNNIQADWEAVE